MLIIGIILIVIAASGISGIWSKNEWRLPIFAMSSALERKNRPGAAELYSGFNTRTSMMVVVLYVLYLLGALLVYFKHSRTWVLVVGCLIGLWLLKAVIGLLRAGYSRKVRLLNYLYSPYVLAWRRDRWAAFSDQQIAAAMCEVTGIDRECVEAENDSIDGFLIGLCRHTRPAYEAKLYPEILKDLKHQATQMIRG